MQKWFGTYQWWGYGIWWMWPLVTCHHQTLWLIRMLIILMILIRGASKTEMPPSPLVMFPYTHVQWCCSLHHQPSSPFCRGTNHSWPLLGHRIAPQPLALDEHLPIEGWIKPNGEAQKGNFLNIQASSSKRSTWREKKNESPLFVPKIVVFLFLKWRAKKRSTRKKSIKKGGKKGTSDVSGFKNLVYSELPWFVPHASRLSSTMMPSMTSKMEPKKKQHVFLFKMDLFQKKIGIWWDLFELVSQIPPKRIRSPRLSVLVLASERLKESLLHLLKLYAGKGWFPAPNQSIVLWSKSRCSGVLALLRTPPTRMVDLVTEAACCSSSLSSLLQPYRCSRERSNTPSVWSSCLAPFLRSVRAHLGMSSKKQRPAPQKKGGIQRDIGASTGRREIAGTLNSGTPNSHTNSHKNPLKYGNGRVVPFMAPRKIWGHPAGWKAITSQPIGPSHTTSQLERLEKCGAF